MSFNRVSSLHLVSLFLLFLVYSFSPPFLSFLDDEVSSQSKHERCRKVVFYSPSRFCSYRREYDPCWRDHILSVREHIDSVVEQRQWRKKIGSAFSLFSLLLCFLTQLKQTSPSSSGYQVKKTRNLDNMLRCCSRSEFRAPTFRTCLPGYV